MRDQLPLHVGNDLQPAMAARVDAHLKRCLSCFREFRELAAMRGRLGVLAEQPLPAGILDGFAEEVMARIAIGEPGPAAEPPVPARVLRPFAWQRVAAAAALVLVAISAWRLLDDPTLGVPTRGVADRAGPEATLAAEGGRDAAAVPVGLPSAASGAASGAVVPRTAFDPVLSPSMQRFGGTARPVSAGQPQLGTPGNLDPFTLHGLRLPSETDRILIYQFRMPGVSQHPDFGSGLQLDIDEGTQAPRTPRLREP